MDTSVWKDVIADDELGHFSDDLMANDCWRTTALFGRMWAFYGPWMSGCKGSLTFSVCLVGRAKEHKFSGLSYLNPNAFEIVLLHYLNDLYGHRNWDGRRSHMPRHHGPIDWHSHQHFPVPSASFKVFNQGEGVNDLSTPDHLFVFPVSDDYFVEVCFIQNLLSRDRSGKIAFDATPMQELQDKVFNSIAMKLGPETQTAVNKVKAEAGSLRMCNNFAPLKWPTNIYPPEAGGSSEVRQALRSDA
ncbi:hypothetical protein [Microbulbifer agarilyticus]|uniref:hypothetical protein n=1 Tax=Microbulbifer agarilyticus TaxID=260552 RepID=UPI001CD1C9BC|nr:hypothetical protein [Microbulbifer agarilyticus]MCA0894582.1 hypothetical protein [Microbulbifer agarilyticus]